MWARVVEFMLACWLALSPFIFRHEPGETLLWANDFACAVVIGTLALLSFWRRARAAHLGHIAVAFWLIALAWFAGGRPPAPAHQNYVVFALLLLLIAVVPSRASVPTEEWREFYVRRQSN